MLDANGYLSTQHKKLRPTERLSGVEDTDSDLMNRSLGLALVRAARRTVVLLSVPLALPTIPSFARGPAIARGLLLVGACMAEPRWASRRFFDLTRVVDL